MMNSGPDRRPKRRISSFALATAGVGGTIAAAAAAGWAAHDAATPPPAVEARASSAPAPSTPTSKAEIPPPQAPDPPQPVMREIHGIRVEDHPLADKLLGLSVRCGRLGGREVYASLLDLLRLRKIGYASPPFRYEIRHYEREGYAYVVIREQMHQRGGRPYPGAPGYVAHTYYYDTPLDRFQLVDSTPEEPEFDQALLRGWGNPLGFLGSHWEAVCNGSLYLHPVKASSDHQKRDDAPAAPKPPASGLGQWSNERPTAPDTP